MILSVYTLLAVYFVIYITLDETISVNFFVFFDTTKTSKKRYFQDFAMAFDIYSIDDLGDGYICRERIQFR